MKRLYKFLVIAACFSLFFLAGEAVYGNNVMSLRNGTPMDRAFNVPVNYSNDPALLVSSLTAGLDDYSKAKVLHDWIALNIAYDTESYFSGDFKPMDPASVFSRKTAVCAGYSALYKYFCDLAGLECSVVVGKAKGYCYPAYGIIEEHAWNLVIIDGMAYLVDVTWDAGFVSGTEFKAKYRTDYFFLHPYYFIYTHIPYEEEWQFISPSVTEEQFANLPFINGKFFAMGLEVLSPTVYSNKVTNYFEARLKVPEQVYLMAELETKEGYKLPGYAYVEKKGAECIVKVTVPYSHTDHYLLNILAGDLSGYKEVMQYKLYM